MIGWWFPTDSKGIPHIKDSVFVDVLPKNAATDFDDKWRSTSVEMPQDEQYLVEDSYWLNYRKVPATASPSSLTGSYSI